MNFYESWCFLKNHPIFHSGSEFLEGLDICVVKICEKTGQVEDDSKRNTKVRIWLEHGPVRKGKAFPYTHDVDLDCGGGHIRGGNLYFG